MTRSSKSSDETVAAREGKGAKKRKAPPSKAVAKPYEPTPQERTAVEAFHAREGRRIPAPSVKITRKGGVAELSVCHEDQGLGSVLLSEALRMSVKPSARSRSSATYCGAIQMPGILARRIVVVSRGASAEVELRAPTRPAAPAAKRAMREE